MDRQFLDIKEARNDLEAYSYEFRNNLSEGANFEKHCAKEVRDPFLAQLNETVDWLYGAGENAPLEELQKRLSAFRAIGDPIKRRYVFHSMIEESYKIFGIVCSKINTKLADAKMSDDNRNSIISKVGVAQEMMDKLRKELDTRPKHEDMSVTLESVQRGIEMLEAETKAIFDLPPPKVEEPKKEEPAAAKEEQPAEAAPEAKGEDVEMKEGEPAV